MKYQNLWSKAFFLFLCLFTVKVIAQGTKMPSDSIIQNAIKKGIMYMESSDNDLEVSVCMLYSLLQRTHQNAFVDIKQSRSTNIISSAIIENNAKWQPFFRLIKEYPKPNQSIFNELSGIDSITAQALWADKIVLDSTFLIVLDSLARKGNYELTHSYLSLIWLKENNHSLIKTRDFQALEHQFQSKIIALLNNRFGSYWYDIHAEALALLLYNHFDKNAIKPEWLYHLIKRQQPNGGWQMSAKNGETSTHATALALWVLLAYKTQPTPSYKWIYH